MKFEKVSGICLTMNNHGMRYYAFQGFEQEILVIYIAASWFLN